MKTLTIKIAPGMDRSLIDLAHRRKTTKSKIVREALETYIDKELQSGEESCWDRIKDLAGIVDGPEDLSTNKKYMEGFGE